MQHQSVLSIFKHLGQGNTELGRKSKRRVSSVTKLLQQSTSLKEWDVDLEVHPTTQAAVHTGTKLHSLHPSPTAFPTTLQLLLGVDANIPFHPQASLIGNTPLLRHLSTRWQREGEPGFPPGFFSRAHSPSSEGREKRSTQAQYCRSQTLVFWALRTAILAKYRTHHWQTEHPLKCLSLRLFLLLPVIFYTIQE